MRLADQGRQDLQHLPPEIRTSASTIANRVGDLFPPERPFIATAVASRQHEFATGRVLARQLLADLGHPDFPLLRNEDRVPRWPEGIVGSISHIRSICVAAVGLESQNSGVGLDIEPNEPVERIG